MKMSLVSRSMTSWFPYAQNRLQTNVKLSLLFCASLFINVLLGQTSYHSDTPKWIEMMYSGNFNPEEVSKVYEEYYQTHEFVKNKYTQDYKRYIRSNTRGDIDLSKGFQISQVRSNQKAYKNKLITTDRNTADWKPLGPFDVDLNSSSVGSTPGLAHIYTVEKSPNGSSFLVAGAATAGVWKSSDNGLSWSSITHDLMVTEVKAVEIGIGSDNLIFFGGNGNVYKSSNGGSSWIATGDNTFKSKYHHISDIVTDPNNGQVIYAASNHGLYKSADQGSNWTLKVSGSFQEIEIHPTDSQIIYAVKRQGQGTAFYKSTDGGNTFSNVGNGYPSVSGSEEQLRTEIAVTPASPDKIVALATGKANGGEGLYGIYISEDKGENWSFRCCGTGPGGKAASDNVNIMAWQTNGLSDGGQYYYDLALAISNTDDDEIYTGGINIWKSTDGGQNFVNNADYIYKKAKEKYVHADIQDLRIYGNEIWVATDGGIFISNDNAESFTKRMYGIVGTDFRGFGAGAKDGEVLIGGTYHNGTLIKENNTYEGGWLSTYSGDNTQGNVNPQNNMITYSDIGIMTLPGDRMAIPSLKFVSKKPNSSYYTGESSEYVFNPNNSEEYYIGSGGTLYKTSNNGTSFTALKNFGSGKVTKIEISPIDPNFMYVVYYPDFNSHKQLHKTTDGGATWSNITPDASLFGNTKLWIAWDITASSTSVDELWLARTPQKSANANIDGKQIFKTSDGGVTWSNISSSSMNGEMVTNIIHQKGTNGGVYAGTRRAVYYKNNDMSSWEIFQSGLPALTYSTNLVILYAKGTIVNATHRGVYATDLYETVSKSVSFQVDKTEGLCENDVFEFSSQITGFSQNATYSWTFQNGLPATSSVPNPKVRFKGLGGHDVNLTVTENGTSKTSSQSDFVNIISLCEVESNPGLAVKSFENNYISIPPLDIETNNISFSAWIKRVGDTRNNAGLIRMRRFSESTGLSMSEEGEIKYQWDESGTGHPSGLFVEREKWTHIAMTVSPTKISVYVNGIERSFEGNFEAVNFDQELILGKDLNAYTYYFNGYFDELAIYDTVLSIDEIRRQMNLVRTSTYQNDLIHYFQFNEDADLIKDKLGSKHAYFSGVNDFVNSMAPIGKGSSQVKLIESFGTHSFSDIGVDFNIQSGISCNSELGVYKIERNLSGTSDTYNSDHLYIINHFSEENFMINGELLISNAIEDLQGVYIAPDSFKLYQVDFDAAPNWEENASKNASSYDEQSNNTIIFEVSEESHLEGKFLVGYNQLESSLAISDIYFNLKEVNPGIVNVEWFLHPEDEFILTELQRSGNGKEFETIAVIDNEDGKLNYSFLDRNPYAGKNYYRVKMYYSDMSSDYSKIDFIKVSQDRPGDFLYPNPISGGNMLNIKDIDLEEAVITVFDIQGRRMADFSNLKSPLIDISFLPAGSFYVIVNERTNSKKQMLVKYD